MVLSVLFWNFVTTWITFCDKHVTSAPRTDHSWSEYGPGEIWRPLLQNHPSLLWQKLTFLIFLLTYLFGICLRLAWHYLSMLYKKDLSPFGHFVFSVGNTIPKKLSPYLAISIFRCLRRWKDALGFTISPQMIIWSFFCETFWYQTNS